MSHCAGVEPWSSSRASTRAPFASSSSAVAMSREVQGRAGVATFCVDDGGVLREHLREFVSEAQPRGGVGSQDRTQLHRAPRQGGIELTDA